MSNLETITLIFLAKYLIFLVLLSTLWFFFWLPPQKRQQFLILTVITLPLIYLTAKFLAFFYYDPRPFVTNHLIPLFTHAPDNGFPSDHTLLSGAIASVTFYFNKKISLFFFTATILIGTARVLAGVHHPVDILGSLIIAIIISYLTYKFIFPTFSSFINKHFPKINR